MSLEHPAPSGLTATGKRLVLIGAFFGWLFAGIQMSQMTLLSGAATNEFFRAGHLRPGAALDWRNLLGGSSNEPIEMSLNDEQVKVELKKHKPRWFARYSAIFLFGAAFGGFVFGWLGDQIGRVRAMGTSILFYSLFAGAGYLAKTPEQLLVLRFLSGMGMGGMWPTGVSLASEAWSDAPRSALAGWLGASANFGIMLMSGIAWKWEITNEDWRWVFLIGAVPALHGLWVLAFVPESQQWLAARNKPAEGKAAIKSSSLFRMPLLKLTLIGIALGTIPTLGGWGVTQWFIPWTESVVGSLDASAKALTALVRSSGGALGSLFGGWLATQLGRRKTYFFISLASFGLSEAIYLGMNPTMPAFPWAVFLIGAVTTVFFGWLPLYLPELFPIQARSTGVGISFNTGRILAAIGVLGTGWLTAHFHEDYRQAGGIMSLVYALGMIIILFAPDTSKKKMSE